MGAAARERPLSLFAELGAVPAWSLRTAEMLTLQSPTRIVRGASTPPLLRSATEKLSERLGGSELFEVKGDGLPQVDAADQLAGLVRDLLEAEPVISA